MALPEPGSLTVARARGQASHHTYARIRAVASGICHGRKASRKAASRFAPSRSALGGLSARSGATSGSSSHRLVRFRVSDQASPAISTCLLYTSDAADDLLCVDLGGRRIIK